MTSTPDLSSLRISREGKEQPGRSPVRTRIIGLAVVVVVLVLGYVFLREGIAGPVDVDATSVVLTTPSQANAVLTASGYIVAQKKASVASKGTGRLVFLGVEEGDQVKAGQIIARLEDDDMVAALDRARADLAIAKADLEDADRSLSRQKTLYASSLTSKAELDAAQARANRVAATILSYAAAVRGAEVGLENTRIRAPFNGTVLTKNADVGEVVAPFAASASSRGAVVSMADMSSLQVEADVSESNITRVHNGQPCEITLDAYPDRRYPGYVHKIVPTADRAKATVLTKVAFRERDERVLPEMSAKVTFLGKELAQGASAEPSRLTVPLSAVINRNSQSVALLIRDGKLVETPVRVGATVGDRLEITAGLAQGEQVVLRPDASLTTGTKVKVRQ
jgi:RND family efflux transporter MFP subunit